MIIRSQSRLAVASATGLKRRSMERLNCCSVGSTEAYVHPQCDRRLIRLNSNSELHAERPRHHSIVGAALLEVNDSDYPEGPQHGVIEPAAALQVRDSE